MPPQVSVVMATYNRLAVLRRALAAWEAQQADGLEFELVVADDASEDGTWELLRALRPERFSMKATRVPHGGPGRARNRALDASSGELIVFVGDDIVPRPDLLAQHWRAHRRSGRDTAAFVGYSGWPEGAELTSTMRHITGAGAQQFSYLWLRDGEEYDFRHFYTSNVSLRRAMLDCEPVKFCTDMPLGSFEDVELSYRLWMHGLRIFYLAAAQAYHYHHHTALTFFRRQHSAGRMAVLLYRKYPELRKWMRTAEIDWALQRARRETPGERAATALVHGRLADAEWRLLALAGYYDSAYAEPVDDLLRIVFDYGYLKGLALAMLGEKAEAYLSAYIFHTHVLPVVIRLGPRLHRAGMPPPAADFEALRALAS